MYLLHVKAGISGIFILIDLLPEVVLYDAGGIVAHAELEIDDFLISVLCDPDLVFQRGVMPALVLDKPVVRAQVRLGLL